MRIAPRFVRIALVGAAFAVSAVSAQTTAGLKIGVINVAKLLDQAPQAQAAMAALQEEFAPRQRDIVSMQKDLQQKQDTLQRDSAVMGEEERANLERDIREAQRNVQREQNEYTEDLNIRRNEELSKLQRSLLQEVQTYARNARYDLVVADVLFYSSAVDITEEVLKGLNQGNANQAEQKPASKPASP
jgi:outer membrane protein